MTKPKQPLMSFAATGTVADSLTFQKRGRGTFARQKPTPSDPKSLPQIYHRWLYQDYAAWWNTLTPAVKQQWESDARRLRITGFNYWMSLRLKLLPDIIGGWRLDKIVNNYAIDFSKNANHGVVYGATVVPGVIDHAFHFDGIDDKIVVPHHASLTLEDEITVEAFINPTNLTIRRMLLSKGTFSNYFVRLWHYLNFAYRGVDNAWHSYTATLPLVAGNLYHIMVTNVYGEADAHAYINGDEVTGVWDEGDGTSLPQTNTSDLLIGEWVWGDDLWSFLDELVIYNRILTQSDSKRHSERRYP